MNNAPPAPRIVVFSTSTDMLLSGSLGSRSGEGGGHLEGHHEGHVNQMEPHRSSKSMIRNAFFLFFFSKKCIAKLYNLMTAIRRNIVYIHYINTFT